jgi:hypothetical protein
VFVIDIFALVTCGAIALGCLWLSLGLWRGWSERLPADPGNWWPFDTAVWRAVRRALPILTINLVVAVVAVIASLGGPGSSRYRVAEMLGLLTFALFPVTASVFLKSRPAWLVPPPLRDEVDLWEGGPNE